MISVDLVDIVAFLTASSIGQAMSDSIWDLKMWPLRSMKNLDSREPLVFYRNVYCATLRGVCMKQAVAVSRCRYQLHSC